jgi:hypothetical protein
VVQWPWSEAAAGLGSLQLLYFYSCSSSDGVLG